MKKLPADFTLTRYGMQVRLVEPSDAEFIIHLRCNEKLSRYLNPTSPNVEDQRAWITTYKEREAQGLDYYFIYFYNGIPIGLNRLYNITQDTFVGGSYVFEPGVPFELPIYGALIQFYIGFELLGKKTAYGDIRLGNSKVIKFHDILQVNFTHKDDIDIFYDYSRDKFRQRDKVIHKMLSGAQQ